MDQLVDGGDVVEWAYQSREARNRRWTEFERSLELALGRKLTKEDRESEGYRALVSNYAHAFMFELAIGRQKEASDTLSSNQPKEECDGVQD